MEIKSEETFDTMTEVVFDKQIKYDMDYLLDRAYNSFTVDKANIKLTIPLLKNENKKSIIINYNEVCASINRDPEEVRAYIGKELQMDTSIKENKQLKIDQTVRSVKIIETIVKNYVINHVMCKLCRSCKTRNEKIGRISYMFCDRCKSKRAIEKN